MSTRCTDGRLMRHDPQHDDPDLETDIGKCPECDGEGCERMERRLAIEEGLLRKCRTCEAENINDDPECPNDAVHCEFYTVRP